MSPALYAFLASSGPVGVSRAAVLRWASTQGRSPQTVLRALDRSACRGTTRRTHTWTGVVFVIIRAPEARAS